LSIFGEVESAGISTEEMEKPPLRPDIEQVLNEKKALILH